MNWLFAVCAVLSVALVGNAQAATPTNGSRVAASLSVTDPGSWRTVHKGVDYRKIVLERSEPSYTFELKLVRFDAHEISAQVLDAGKYQLKGARAKTFLEKSGALATINANYFDENGRPLAYLKNSAREINRTVSKHALYTGVFGVRDGLPFVIHRDQFQPAQAREALQSGPLLLLSGAPVDIIPGLGRYARRAVIGIDKTGRIIVGATDAVLGGLSFAELQELFSKPRWQIETPDLLNLDGGSSAQMHLRVGKFEESVPGLSDVPVAIGFFATR